MRLDEMSYPALPPIDSYGPGFFRIGGTVFEGACLLLPSGATRWQGLDDTDPLCAAAPAFDVLLIGSGAVVENLPKDARARLEAAGIGYDLMSSPTACRSYNILLAEGRRVAAALIPV